MFTCIRMIMLEGKPEMPLYRKVLANKRCILTVISVLVVSLYVFDYKVLFTEPRYGKYSVSETSDCENDLKSHNAIVEEYFDLRENWETSNLGSILFKNANPSDFFEIQREEKTFVVLLWKHYDWLKKRHVFNFNSTTESREDIDVLKTCSVKNCKFTGDDTVVLKADAIIIHMQKGMYPDVKVRNPNQRWIFLSDESPKNTFSLAKKAPTLKSLSGVFNWTMTYRSDSDVPVPYGRTIPLDEPVSTEFCSGDIETMLTKLVPFWEEKQFITLAGLLMSNCKVTKRNQILQGIRKYLDVDVFGKCSDEHRYTCPGHFRSDCKITNRYIFYLVLENSNCRQYLSEKCFHNAYSKGAIPVIFGPPLHDCQKLLPPNSFLHVESYKSVFDLATHMKAISSDLKLILAYHEWRKHFRVVNEHGFFGSPSYHLCRVCEALNYNDDEERVYDIDELKLFFSSKISCDTKFGGFA